MRILIGVACFVSIFASALEMSDKELPSAGKAATKTLQNLTSEKDSLNQWLGVYPPKISDKAEEDAIYKKWSALYQDVAAGIEKNRQNDQWLNLYADLLRQGHNMHVKGAGKLAMDTIEECIKLKPTSVPCHLTSSYFYLQISPKFIENAKRSLDFLKKHYSPKLDENNERGFIFYYMQTKQQEKALQAVNSFMKNFPNSQYKSDMEFLKKALKNPIRTTEKSNP